MSAQPSATIIPNSIGLQFVILEIFRLEYGRFFVVLYFHLKFENWIRKFQNIPNPIDSALKNRLVKVTNLSDFAFICYGVFNKWVVMCSKIKCTKPLEDGVQSSWNLYKSIFLGQISPVIFKKIENFDFLRKIVFLQWDLAWLLLNILRSFL